MALPSEVFKKPPKGLKPMRITRDEMMAEIVRTVAKRGTCGRYQVGAVIANRGRVLSIGYNGAPSGAPHCGPSVCSTELPCTRAVHAESNAIAYSAREGISIEGATLYCSLTPCLSCAQLIINAGLARFVYLDEYRDRSGLVLLQEAGIICASQPKL